MEKTTGWHLQNEFVDNDGIVYCKGKPTGEIRKPEEPKKEDSKKEEPKTEAKDSEDLRKEVEELKKLVNDLVSTKTGGGQMTPELLAQAIAKANAEQKGEEVSYSSEDLDPEDWDEKGVTFIAHGRSYVITGDKRNNRSVRPPINKVIKFKFRSGRVINKGSRNQKYLAYSSYKSHSKKEIEWLRAHTQYNRKFHDQATELNDISANSIEAAYKIGKFLDSKSTAQIMALAKQHGIELGSDINAIQRKLHVELTKQETKAIESREAQKAKAAYEAMLFRE